VNRFLSKDFMYGVRFIAFGMTALLSSATIAPGPRLTDGAGYVPTARLICDPWAAVSPRDLLRRPRTWRSKRSGFGRGAALLFSSRRPTYPRCPIATGLACAIAEDGSSCRDRVAAGPLFGAVAVLSKRAQHLVTLMGEPRNGSRSQGEVGNRPVRPAARTYRHVSGVVGWC